MCRQVGLKKKGTGNSKEVTMFAFNDSILLRSTYATGLMKDAFGSIELSHGKFRAIITSDNFDNGGKLGFN